MKTITLLSALLIGSMGFSQVNPVDFEPGGIGADWTFVVFGNGSNPPPLEITGNPEASGANTSATVAKFIARTGAGTQPFAGTFSDNIGTFTLDATNSTVRIKVYKPVISDVGIKFEGNGVINELKVPNTVIDQWEELIFDFSAFIGTAEGTGITRIVIFPDFVARTQENIIYFDDIIFSASLGVEEFQNANFRVYPNPSKNDWTIKSENTVITSVDLIDVNGRQVLSSQPNTFEMTIDTSNISQGIYIARISSDKGVETVKLVKQ